MVDLGIERND